MLLYQRMKGFNSRATKDYLSRRSLLCNELWNAVSNDHCNRDWYFSLIADHICDGSLLYLSPDVTQALVTHLERKDAQTLEKVLLSLDLGCLDLHQVLQICKERKLYDAWIHITTKTIGDYTGPLTEFLDELTPQNHKLGNTILVYVSCCLTGLGYPKGGIPTGQVARVKADVLRCLEAVHSMDSGQDEPTYPYLRAILKYNTRECLNVIGIAFKEAEFSGEMGLLQRQRLVQILMRVIVPPDFEDGQVINLACFVSRLVTSKDLQADESMLDMVVRSLTDMIDRPISLRDHTEREQAWLDLLSAKRLNHMSLEHTLRLALDSKCYRVVQHVYEKQSDYANILTCYLEDSLRRPEVFEYILTYVNVSERFIREQCIVHFKELVSIDAKKAADVAAEHMPGLIGELFATLDDEDDLQFVFLAEIVANEIKLPSHIAERYLQLLCMKDRNAVTAYVQSGLCRVEEALKLTQEYGNYAASALLLQQMGEWHGALDLLLQHGMGGEAISVCINGAEHLDAVSVQQLWLKLLRNSGATVGPSLRQLLHAAAPHVPPAQLLQLVSDVSLGDVKSLLEGILSDCMHDIDTLTITLKLLGKDLHQGLAKALFDNGRAVSVSGSVCNICRLPLATNCLRGDPNGVLVWSCGHCFHDVCFTVSETDNHSCPCCRTAGTLSIPKLTKSTPTKSKMKNDIRSRPDLEGHF